MRILHTSDWHLGKSLYGRKRYDEFEAFFDWLIQTITTERVDILLVAGDVFDTNTPSNRAQALYYEFLCRVSNTCCRHVVVIAGNHDSPSFLNAPKALLRVLNVYVVGSVSENLADEVIVLSSNEGPEAIVCAVPYLRDRDIRVFEPGEDIDNKNAKLVEGLKRHYGEVCKIAEEQRTKFREAGHEGLPLIAMGHLFTSGGKTVDGDGVRDLYVGSLAHVGRDVFPSCVDYLALGHLHVPQVVGEASHFRYSGSPIPMGFGESTQQKIVVIVEFSGGERAIRDLPVPCFQALVRIEGTLEEIETEICGLRGRGSDAWLEIEYTGKEPAGNLREVVEEALSGTAMEVRRIKNRRVMERVFSASATKESLDDLDVHDVFVRCLDACNVPDEAREGLMRAYEEVVSAYHDDDVNAE